MLPKTLAEEKRPQVANLAWQEILPDLDPQTACELLGIQHFPHWLASAANMLLLARHLKKKQGGGLTVGQALAKELMAGPHPPSGSKDTDNWKAMEPLVKELAASIEPIDDEDQKE